MRATRSVAVLVVALMTTVITTGMTTLMSPPTAAVAWTTPTHPANRAAPISGAVNGQLDPSLLVTVEGSCQLTRGAATALTRLLADARAHGVGLGTDSCYRPLAAQIGTHQNACSSGNCACAATPAT